MIWIILKWCFFNFRLGASVIEEFLPKIPSWPVILISICFSIYWYGHNQGSNSCELKYIKIEQKMDKKHDKIETNVNNLSDSQLDKRLHKFQRD